MSTGSNALPLSNVPVVYSRNMAGPYPEDGDTPSSSSALTGKASQGKAPIPLARLEAGLCSEAAKHVGEELVGKILVALKQEAARRGRP